MSAQDSSKASQTDWDHLADPSDDDIDYSDIPPLDEVFFRDATLRLPQPQEAVTIRLDADVLAWFKAQGERYPALISSVLRAYKEAHGSA
jgi:uncharacterized protein (DUF4415 family)